MSEVLDQDREAEAADPTPSHPDGDRGPVQSPEGSEAVLVPLIIPYEKLNAVLVTIADAAAAMSLRDRAFQLEEYADPAQPETYLVTEPARLSTRLNEARDFISGIADQLRATEGTVRPLTITELIEDSHARAARKGFWDGHSERTERDVINEKLLLIISELTEAMEEVRSGHEVSEIWYEPKNDGDTVALKPEGFTIEVADAMIRIADLFGWLDIDLTEAIRLKAAYNETRPHKHGKQF